MDNFKMVVEGFLFTDERMAQAACQEVEGIKYVRERLDMENPHMVLEMYHKLLAEQVFETPVGMMYLKELQDYLLVEPELAEEEIEPIEVFERMQSFFEQTQMAESGDNQGHQSEQASEELIQSQQNWEQQKESSTVQQSEGQKKESVQAQQSANQIKESVQAQQSADAANKLFQEKQLQEPKTPPMEEGTLDWYVEKLEESKRKERDLDFRRRRAEERTKQSRKHLYFSLLGSLFLFLVAAGMVAITFMDQNPNILNYENRIIEKYEMWEAELENREQLLKDKE